MGANRVTPVGSMKGVDGCKQGDTGSMKGVVGYKQGDTCRQHEGS